MKHRYSVKITGRSGSGSVASIFRDGVHIEDVGPIAEYRGRGKKGDDSAALRAARDRVFDFKVLDYGRAGGRGLYPGRPPKRKNMTKLQRMNAASKRSKQKRIAKALRAYVDAQYGPGKVTEVRVRKNPSGSHTLIPVRRRRTR